jgi:lysophospholipase
VTGKCPTPAPVVRKTTPIQELGEEEKAYLLKREPKSRAAWKTFLNNLQIPGVDVASLVDSPTPLPVISWTASGGGYRAMINAGAHYWAKDARNPQATPLRGFVQLLTYHDGLSGGSWFLCSNIANDYPTVPGMIKNIWNLQENLVYPGSNNIQAAFTIRRWLDQVAQKKNAGFNTSLTDLWARALSLHILLPSIDSTDYRLTDIRGRYPVKDADIGFPLFEADNQFRNKSNTFTNQWEWNLFETGSYAPNISGFIPTEYIGTTFQNGQVADTGKCVTYFDNTLFAFGTSSSAFNVAINGSVFNDSYSSTYIEPVMAAQVPNPFLNIPAVDENVRDSPTIGLADGGLDLQNVPLWTLVCLFVYSNNVIAEP